MVLNRKELSGSTIEDELVDLQIKEDVRRLIKALPFVQMQVLVMRYYRNLSFKEIAELTGVSINTALGRMRYAIPKPQTDGTGKQHSADALMCGGDYCRVIN